MLSKRNRNQLNGLLTLWLNNGDIKEEQVKQVQCLVEPKLVDWYFISKVAFIFSIISIAVAAIYFVFNKELLALLTLIINSSLSVKALELGTFAVLFYSSSLYVTLKKSNQTNKKETLLFLANFFFFATMIVLCLLFNINLWYGKQLLLLCSIVLFAITLLFHSKPTWILAVVTLGFSYGLYIESLNNFYLNFLFISVSFGLLLLLSSFLIRKVNYLKYFSDVNLSISIFLVFSSFYLITIFGHTNSLSEWMSIKQTTLFYWPIAFLLFSIGMVVLGRVCKVNNIVSVSYLAIFINVITCYFAYCWTILPKTIFFLILGILFWLVGSKGEKLLTRPT